MSTDAQVEAIKAIIATATKAPALDLDEARALGQQLPASYTEVYVTRRFGGTSRGGMQENYLRRLQTRAVADTITNARLLEDRVADAFAYSTHDLGDDVLTHFNYESGGGDFDYDTATRRYHALTDWTFAV